MVPGRGRNDRDRVPERGRTPGRQIRPLARAHRPDALTQRHEQCPRRRLLGGTTPDGARAGDRMAHVLPADPLPAQPETGAPVRPRDVPPHPAPRRRAGSRPRRADQHLRSTRPAPGRQLAAVRSAAGGPPRAPRHRGRGRGLPQGAASPAPAPGTRAAGPLAVRAGGPRGPAGGVPRRPGTAGRNPPAVRRATPGHGRTRPGVRLARPCAGRRGGPVAGDPPAGHGKPHPGVHPAEPARPRAHAVHDRRRAPHIPQLPVPDLSAPAAGRHGRGLDPHPPAGGRPPRPGGASLRTTPIHAIAARWGFPRASDFTRAFRAAYGLSPKECRFQGPSEGE